MRVAISCLTGMAVLCGSAAFAITPTSGNAQDPSSIQAQKALLNVPGNLNPINVDIGGDTIGSTVVTELVPCVVDCPPGGLAEGEPDCHDGYVDTYNGGCFSVPPVFSTLTCGWSGQPILVCGSYGGFLYNGLSYRDTDWYEITVSGPSDITWCVAGETDTLVGIIQPPCPVASFYSYSYGGDCTSICVDETLPAGTWYLWVSSLNFGLNAGPCGQDYVATLDGCWGGIIAVEPTTWSTVKSRYR